MSEYTYNQKRYDDDDNVVEIEKNVNISTRDYVKVRFPGYRISIMSEGYPWFQLIIENDSRTESVNLHLHDLKSLQFAIEEITKEKQND